LLIGRKERLEFVEWGLPRFRVKVDTGARTSALDVMRYELRETPGHGLTAVMHLALRPKNCEVDITVEASVLGMVKVRNTGGRFEERPLIETEVRLGPIRKRIRLTIANRAGMCYRMILGREALAGDFVVDVSRKYLLK
jgi:hypothetical protein